MSGLPARRRWPTPLAALAYLLLSALTTAPLWRDLARAVPIDIGDPLLNTWILSWDVHAWLSAPGRLFQANIFAPLPDTLAYSEHLFSTAALALPLLVALGEPVAVYNLLTLFHLALGGLGMYLLAAHWTGKRPAAFAAGVAFAFGPYRLASIGHLQLLAVGWLPLAILALDRLLERGDRRSALLLFVFFLAQALSCWYLALFAALVLAIYLACATLARAVGWGGLIRAGLALLPAALILALVAIPYVRVMPLLSAARPPGLALSFAAVPGDYLAAAWFNRFFSGLTAAFANRPGFTDENALFPGVVTPLCALVSLAALKGRERWRLAALWAVVAVSVALTFPGPYGLLSRLLPFLAVVRVPPRWVIPATFALAALCGYGLAAVQSRSPRGGPALIALLGVGLFLEGYGAPLPLAPVQRPAELPQVYRWLAGQQGDFAIVELPMYSIPGPEYPEVKRLYASTLHWKDLVNGYSGMTPPRQTGLAGQLSDFPGEEASEALRGLARSGGLRYVLVHSAEEGFDRQTWEQQGRWLADRSPTFRPVYSDGADYVYEVNPYGPALATEPETVGGDDPYWRAHRPRKAGVVFDGGPELLAWRLERDGPQASLVLYWRARQPVTKDYTIFVHLLDGAGAIVAQADSPPVAGRYPTTAWQPGEVVQDVHLLPLSGGGEPPGMRIAVGLYDPSTLERLAAHKEEGQEISEGRVFLD